jgi:hypothetical protein
VRCARAGLCRECSLPEVAAVSTLVPKVRNLFGQTGMTGWGEGTPPTGERQAN